MPLITCTRWGFDRSSTNNLLRDWRRHIRMDRASSWETSTQGSATASRAKRESFENTVFDVKPRRKYKCQTETCLSNFVRNMDTWSVTQFCQAQTAKRPLTSIYEPSPQMTSPRTSLRRWTCCSYQRAVPNVCFQFEATASLALLRTIFQSLQSSRWALLGNSQTQDATS